MATPTAYTAPDSHTLFTVLSLILSVAVCSISLANYSSLLLCLNATTAALTVVYHLGVINWPRRRSPGGAPTTLIPAFFWPKMPLLLMNTICCGVVLSLWTGVFTIALEVAISGPKHAIFGQATGRPWNIGVQIAIVVLTGLHIAVIVLCLRGCFNIQFASSTGEEPIAGSPLTSLNTQSPNNIPGTRDLEANKPSSRSTTPQALMSSIRVLPETFVHLDPTIINPKR